MMTLFNSRYPYLLRLIALIYMLADLKDKNRAAFDSLPPNPIDIWSKA